MNVFQKGDVVYHAVDGQITINLVTVQGRILAVNGMYYQKEYLSFSPWPKPNHTRPFKEGWWIVAFYDGSFGVKWRVSETQFKTTPRSKNSMPLNCVFDEKRNKWVKEVNL